MLPLFLSILGICAAFIQLLLFREILPVFQTVDIAVGFFTAHVLFSFALGVYGASYLKLSEHTKKSLIVTVSGLLILFFFAFFFVRDIRNLINVAPGGGISLRLMFIYILLAVFPVTFVQGAASYLSLKYIKMKGKETPVQTAFIFAGLGFIGACVIYSFYMTALPGLQIVLIVAALLTFACAILFESQKAALYMLTLSAVILLFLGTGTVINADKKILQRSYGPAVVEDYSYTPYGQNVLIQKNNEYTLLVNGIKRFSVPDDDAINSEDFGHIPVLHSKKPDNVLIIGGAAKYLPMIFAYPVKRVDYVESDGAVIDIIKNNVAHLGYVFNDDRLHIHNINARVFLKNSGVKYDLILVGLPNPTTLHLNSFYTKEFFELADGALKKDGFVSVKLPGRMAYSTYIMAELNKSVQEAMQSVFRYFQIIPGTQNILIASQNSMPYRLHIKKRLYEVQETTLVLSKYYLDDRMDTEKTRWLRNEIRRIERPGLINTDKSPQAFMLSILHWQSGFSPYLSVALEKIIQYSYLIIILIIIIFFLSKSIYQTTSFVSGAGSFWLILTAVFTVQAYGGQIFKWGGFLAALLAAGMFLGFLYTKFMNDGVPLNKRMFESELLFVLLILLWFFFFIIIEINIYILFTLVFLTGFTAGLEFAQLVKISKLFSASKSSLEIYVAGALGGWFAAMVGGSFLILSWGSEKSLLFILFLKFLIFCRWADLKKRGL